MEAARRRTFAVISRPDAGKSTLTEALALHAAVIEEAGAAHGSRDDRIVKTRMLISHVPVPLRDASTLLSINAQEGRDVLALRVDEAFDAIPASLAMTV